MTESFKATITKTAAAQPLGEYAPTTVDADKAAADAIRTAIVRADSDIDLLRRLADDAKGE